MFPLRLRVYSASIAILHRICSSVPGATTNGSSRRRLVVGRRLCREIAPDNLLTTFNIGSSGSAVAQECRRRFSSAMCLLYSNAASSNYDGLQTQVQKRLSNNIQGQVSYTYSRTTDNAIGLIGSLGDSRSGGRSGPINPFDLDADRGRSSLDIPHLFSADAIIDLPFGKGQKYLNGGGAVGQDAGGWQLNILQTARSGFPFTVVCNCDLVRPTQISDPVCRSGPGPLLERRRLFDHHRELLHYRPMLPEQLSAMVAWAEIRSTVRLFGTLTFRSSKRLDLPRMSERRSALSSSTSGTIQS